MTQEVRDADLFSVLAEGGRHYMPTVGDSMRPMLHGRHDTVVIEPPSRPLKKMDIPLYRRPDGQYVLHRIVGVRPDGYVTCGDNRRRREYGVTDEMVVGILVGYYRGEKEISLSSWRYRLYVTFWCRPYYLRAFCLCVRDAWRTLRGKRRKG